MNCSCGVLPVFYPGYFLKQKRVKTKLGISYKQVFGDKYHKICMDSYEIGLEVLLLTSSKPTLRPSRLKEYASH